MTRVLTLRELNRTTLLRQLLLRRERLSPVAAIERLAGLQAQWAPSPYVALWSRVDGFRRPSLEQALRRDRVVKATLMRATLHLVSARDYALFQAALREVVTTIRTRREPPPPEEVVAAARALADQGPLTRRQLRELLGHERAIVPATDERVIRQLQWLLVLAELEQVPEAAFWSPPRETSFRRLHVPLPDPVEGRAHLVRRYLAAFGPASRQDLATWSRARLRDLDPALESLRLRRFHDEEGRELLDLARAPLAAADLPAPVRFLPRWDQLLLAHDRRERVMHDELRRVMIAPNGDVADTFLVDGWVAGRWREQDGRVVLDPFEPLPLRVRREVKDEARRLEAFLR